jgi:contractile injection system tube protein
VAKATIAKLDKQGKSVGTPVEVMFNPKEVTLSRQNNWKQEQGPKTNIPATEFTTGGATTLKMQFYFDTYEKGDDVRKHTKPIHELMDMDEAWYDKKSKKGRPPSVRFQWGKVVAFDAVITSVSTRYTLFLPEDGTPVRAVMDISFTQVKDKAAKPKQNPTSGGVGGDRVWIVREGDTLAWIAFNTYDDPNDWRLIADANRLTQVRKLTPGTTLVIPSA